MLKFIIDKNQQLKLDKSKVLYVLSQGLAVSIVFINDTKLTIDFRTKEEVNQFVSRF